MFFNVGNASAGSVLNVAFEVAAHADTVDGGRRKHERVGLGHALFQSHIRLSQNGVERDSLLDALFLGAETHEHCARIADFCERCAAYARDCRHVLNAVDFRENLQALVNRLFGVFKRHAVGQLHCAEDVAVVLFGNEALGHYLELVARKEEQPDIQKQNQEREPQNSADEISVFFGSPEEAFVESPEEPAEAEIPEPCKPVFALALFHQNCAKRGRKRKRNNRRNDCGGGNGKRELAVELPRNAVDKRRGNEHGTEHKRYCNQRALNLAHGLFGGFARVEAVAHVALHVFDNHDCVVNYDTDCKHQAEQRKVVYRKAEQQHKKERAHKRNGNRENRDNRRAPILQEHHHNQNDKQNRLVNGVVDGVD